MKKTGAQYWACQMAGWSGVDETVSETVVPPMLLQTLVENAIKHGVEEVPSGRDLFIRAVREGDALRIEVENTGSLNSPRPGSTQVGLKNARERLLDQHHRRLFAPYDVFEKRFQSAVPLHWHCRRTNRGAEAAPAGTTALR